MNKLHLAIGVANIKKTVEDYSKRFGKKPDLVIPDEYALWRTDKLNVSVRKATNEEVGQLRHLGWESDDIENFSTDVDCNGILWEEFSAKKQADEINDLWPGTDYKPK